MKHSELRDALRGILVTPVTPFNHDLSLDEEGLRESVRFLVESGANVITPCGSIGEWSSLTSREMDRVIELTIDEANGRVPVVAGVSNTSTLEAAEKAQRADDMGADGILVLPAFYMRYHLEGLVKHFQHVASATDLGMVLYNSPDFLGFDLLTSELLEIINKVPSVVAIKDSTTDMLEFAHRITLVGDRVKELLGNEPYCYYGLSVGAPGTFTSVANFAPKPLQQLYKSIKNGESTRARTIFLRLTKYFAFRRITKNPVAVVKQAMILMGIKINPLVRPPLVELSDKQRLELEVILKELVGEIQEPILASSRSVS